MGFAYSFEESLAILSATPGTLRAWLASMPPRWLEAEEGDGTFRPLDVIGHLIHGEKTDWIPRAKRLLEFGESKAFDSFDRWGHREAIRGKSLEALLEEFAKLRQQSLETLAAFRLSPEDLHRCGRHPKFGAVTLEQLLATWVVHDLEHIAQIARVMGKQYREAVGPWVEYLPMIQAKRG